MQYDMISQSTYYGDISAQWSLVGESLAYGGNAKLEIATIKGLHFPDSRDGFHFKLVHDMMIEQTNARLMSYRLSKIGLWKLGS